MDERLLIPDSDSDRAPHNSVDVEELPVSAEPVKDDSPNQAVGLEPSLGKVAVAAPLQVQGVQELKENAPTSIARSEQEKPRVEEPDYPMVWPHKVGASLSFNGVVTVTGTLSHSPASKRRYPGLSRRERTMRQLNGEGSEDLALKYKFIEMARKLGYNAPRQLQVEAHESVDQKFARAREVFPNDDDQIICATTGGG